MFSIKAPTGNAVIAMLGGNVGVNTIAPQASLDVNGLLRANSQISFATSGPGTVGVGPLGNSIADRVILAPGNATTYPYSLGVQGTTCYLSVPAGSWHELLVAGQPALAAGNTGTTVPGTLTSNSLTVSGVSNLANVNVSGTFSVTGALAYTNLSASNVTASNVLIVGKSINLPNAGTFTGNEADLGNRMYTTCYNAASQGVAPVATINSKVYNGMASCLSGVATFYPTLNGLANGTPIFGNISSVQTTALVNTTVANAVPTASLRSISNTTVVVNVVTPTGTVVTTSGLGGAQHHLLSRPGTQWVSRVSHIDRCLAHTSLCGRSPISKLYARR